MDPIAYSPQQTDAALDLIEAQRSHLQSRLSIISFKMNDLMSNQRALLTEMTEQQSNTTTHASAVDDSPEQNITDHPQMNEIFRRQLRLEQATHAVRSKIKGLQEKEQQILKKHHEWMANEEEKKLKQEADTAAQQR